MRNGPLALALLLALLLPAGRAQQGDAPVPPSEEKGTYLGVLFSPVPDVLYDHLPSLPRGRGVVVTHVLPDSPAAAAGLRRHDILLRYDDEPIRDCEHFARLIRADKPGRMLTLLLLRGGREVTVAVTLALGPVLRIAQVNRAAETPRALVKPAGPPAVSVSAVPLSGNSMQVTIEYYQEGTGRLRTVTCSGTPAEIDDEVQRLPARVKDLTRAAIDRIRALDLQKHTETRIVAPRDGR